jgi:hypothetical protein
MRNPSKDFVTGSLGWLGSVSLPSSAAFKPAEQGQILSSESKSQEPQNRDLGIDFRPPGFARCIRRSFT